MNLILDKWTIEDGKRFSQYLLSLSKGEEKASFEQRIVNTSHPCIAVSCVNIDKVVKAIAKGNFIDFLRLKLYSNHAEAVIRAKLIVKIKDFTLMEQYLSEYITEIDNWACTDCMKFAIKDSNRNDYFDLAKRYIKSNYVYVRRCALIILLKLTVFVDMIPDILEICDSIYSEREYYVNMANAWLVAECVAKSRDIGMQYMEHNNLNNFTMNKAISKCHDSYRISQEDKQYLKTLRRK